jgi:signal transduction histidine kinase
VKSPFTSLRGRLVLGALLVGIAFACVFGGVATWRLHHLEDRAVSTALQSRLDLARDEVAPDGTLIRDQASPKTDLVQLIGSDGTVRSTSPGLANVGPLEDVANVVNSPSGVRARHAIEQPDIDLATLSVPINLPRLGRSPAGIGVLVVAVDAEGFTSATADLLELLVGGLGSVIVAIGVLSWWLTGRALRSVTRLTEEAEAVDARDLMSGLPVPVGDVELARLVSALNRMLVRLHDSHDKELAFAADAGHRLRTPIATLRAEAELALREVDPAQQVQALQRIVSDADQLTSIVDRVLARSRAHGEVAPSIRAAFASVTPMWSRRGDIAGVDVAVDLDSTVHDDMVCPGLIDVAEPLVDNAIQHSEQGGAVRVATASIEVRGQPTIVVDVSDHGSGVDQELAPLIFDAWVSSRDASVAGGLGLWIAREQARDLGGDVVLLNTAPGGTTFRVTLPLARHDAVATATAADRGQSAPD